MKANMNESGIIIVLHFHQRPAQAFCYDDESELINDWWNGQFAAVCFADNALKVADEKGEDNVTIDDALADISHDLHSLSVLRSPKDVAAHLAGKGHNWGYGVVREAAAQLRWIKQEEEVES